MKILPQETKAVSRLTLADLKPIIMELFGDDVDTNFDYSCMCKYEVFLHNGKPSHGTVTYNKIKVTFKDYHIAYWPIFNHQEEIGPDELLRILQGK